MKNKKRLTALLLSAVLLCPQCPAFAEEMPDSFDNILTNPGFETETSYDFPQDWVSDGQNMIPNGDFEDNTLSAGYNLANNKMMQYKNVGGAAKVEVCENENAPEVLGRYALKATWGNDLI